MSALSIVLIEDDPAACQRFVNCADVKEDISIVSVTNSAKKAVQDIHDYIPDAIILDLELHLGSGSGIDVLKEIQRIDAPMRPYVIISTNNTSGVTHEYIRELGADFIMTKHQEDYSEEKVLDFLIGISSVLKNRKRTSTYAQDMMASPAEQKKRLTRRISAELDRVGIRTKVIGYQYLLEAIMILMDGPMPNITTIIGQKYGKTESSVERAMQNAINYAWRTTDTDMLLLHYTAPVRSDKGVPTLTEFIHYYANKLKNE